MHSKKGGLGLSLSTIFFMLIFVLAVSTLLLEALLEKTNLAELEQIMQVAAMESLDSISRDLLGTGELFSSSYAFERRISTSIEEHISELKGFSMLEDLEVQVSIEKKTIQIDCTVKVKTRLASQRTVKRSYLYYANFMGG